MMNEAVQIFKNKESFDFDEFLANNQFENTSILERFLKDVYRELSNSKDGINKDIFREFINLPSYIADKIFNSMCKTNNKLLGLNDFLNGMKSLYNGDFLQLTKFIFDFYDFDKDGKIIYEDVKQIQLLILPSQYHNEEVFESIKDSLDSFFEDYKYLDYENFIYISENFNSDIFMNLIIYFYVNKPFSNDILNYYLSDKRLAEMRLKNLAKFTFKKTFTLCEPDTRKKNFSISKQDEPLELSSQKMKALEITAKIEGTRKKSVNISLQEVQKKQTNNINSKNMIKTPKYNLYLQKISENYCRMVTYTEPPQNDDNQAVSGDRNIQDYQYDEYDILEEPADENEYNFTIKLPIVRRFRNLFNPRYYEEETALRQSINYNISSGMMKKRSLTENDVIIVQKSENEQNLKKTSENNISENSNTVISNNSEIASKLAISPQKSNKKKVISKFHRSYTFNFDKSDFPNSKQEDNKDNISQNDFISDDSFVLKQMPKVTYENFIFKYNQKKDKVIRYYILLNNKMMLYFKNESKNQYRGLHYLSDNYSKISYDKTKTIHSNGLKYYYLNLSIKNSKKWFVSKSEFEMRKWYEVLKKTINPHKSRMLKDFYILKETICEGKYGVVKRAVSKKTKQDFSIKIINRKSLKDTKSYEMITKEIEILRHCNHRSILKYIDHFEEINEEQNKDYVHIVMEYLNGGDLANYIHKNGALHESKVIGITWDIARGLEYLHKLGIVHRDIKPENIVFDKMQKPRIVDFGLSEIINHNEYLTESYGTYFYASPEIHNKSKYNKQTDIWSLGILIYYILTADLPFDKNKDQAHIFIADLKTELSFDNINFINASKKMQDLIEKCLRKDMDERFTIDQLLNHEVFQKYH